MADLCVVLKYFESNIQIGSFFHSLPIRNSNPKKMWNKFLPRLMKNSLLQIVNPHVGTQEFTYRCMWMCMVVQRRGNHCQHHLIGAGHQGPKGFNIAFFVYIAIKVIYHFVQFKKVSVSTKVSHRLTLALKLSGSVLHEVFQCFWFLLSAESFWSL